MNATLLIDPARLSTVQQKLMSFKQRRVFTNPRVAAGMRLVEAAARADSSSLRSSTTRRPPAQTPDHQGKFVARDCINWSNNDHCAITKCNYCHPNCKGYVRYK